MTTEQTFFFQVLRDHLQGQVTAAPEQLDWDQVCTWAEAHKLGGIFFTQCAAIVKDAAIFRRLNTAFGAAIGNSENLMRSFSLLRSALSAQNIPFLPVKGAVIASRYPVPELRTMGDIDILVHAEDRDRIRSSLEAKGFQNVKWADDEWHYSLNQSLFEIQGHLMKRDEPGLGHIYNYFNDFWPHACQTPEGGLRLEPSFHFFYLIAHIAKHLRWSGVGFRQFYDLAILMQDGRERYDWDWIRAEAERIGFFRFTVCCLALVERWFGVPSPYGTEALSEELYGSITEKIFQDGVFGFSNDDNQVYELEQARRRSSQPLALVKLRSAARLAFPSYKTLTVSEKYAYLRGKPWLLPYAWVRRAVRGRHSANAQELGAVLSASGSELRRRADQLRDLGLEVSE